ncbi:MAG TPA: MmcQ/YjbR family DNA-binding protein [Edaphobacter sp.]
MQAGHTMTSHIDRFRKLALSLPGAIESSHMGNPDFRVDERIFATLSAQASGRGVLKLTVEQQQAFITEMPATFQPVNGGWGRMGMTFVDLKADKSTIEGALTTAYNNIKAKQAKKKTGRSGDTGKPARPRLQ